MLSRLALGREHLLEHALELDVHLHARLPEHADDAWRALRCVISIGSVFELAGLELLAKFFARALLALASASSIVEPNVDSSSGRQQVIEQPLLDVLLGVGSLTASVISSRTMAMDESSRSRIIDSTSRPW